MIAGDAVRGAAAVADKLRGTGWAGSLACPRYYRIVLLCALGAFCYGLYEAYAVRATHIVIAAGKLPAGVDTFRIVAASDIHLTRRGDEARLRRLVDLINRQKPDLAVLLGDIVDDLIVDEDGLLRELQRIAAPAGKFAVLGNHELYSGIDQAVEFTQKAGFTVLRGENAAAGPVVVAGVDDPALGTRADIPDTLRRVDDGGRFVLLLAHRPETPEEEEGLFDLQLSGHTHGGQLRPGRLFTRLFFRHRQGLNTLPGPEGNGGLLYLTNGAGYWGPPVRFFAPPEIVVIDLKRK